MELRFKHLGSASVEKLFKILKYLSAQMLHKRSKVLSPPAGATLFWTGAQIRDGRQYVEFFKFRKVLAI